MFMQVLVLDKYVLPLRTSILGRIVGMLSDPVAEKGDRYV